MRSTPASLSLHGPRAERAPPSSNTRTHTHTHSHIHITPWQPSAWTASPLYPCPSSQAGRGRRALRSSMRLAHGPTAAAQKSSGGPVSVFLRCWGMGERARCVCACICSMDVGWVRGKGHGHAGTRETEMRQTRPPDKPSLSPFFPLSLSLSLSPQSCRSAYARAWRGRPTSS